MRVLIVVVLALAFPAAAHAGGAIGLEGSQLVYRADPGTGGRLIIARADDTITVNPVGSELRVGAGCSSGRTGVGCPIAGVSGLTVLAGDGDDEVDVFVPMPVTFDAGPGDDLFNVSGTTVAIDAGPGNDEVGVMADAGTVALGDGNDLAEVDGDGKGPGPYTIDGGAGDDLISLMARGSGMTLIGGAGDDRLYATVGGRAPVSIVCGPGADRWGATPRDTPGDGCAAHLAGITPRTVSRAFQEGALTGPASGSVTLTRREGFSSFETVARGVFTARPGPLRVSLKRTRAGTRRLRRTPRLPVVVTIRTRTGADGGEVAFRSRLG